MLSRRNIRIKVMQMLYARSRDKDLTFREVVDNYRQSINNSYELYMFNLYELVQIAAYSLKDASKRAVKHLPTEEDKKFTPKLINNELIQSIIKDEYYTEFVKKYEFDGRIDEDNIRRFYSNFAEGEAYRKYLGDDTTLDDHKQILLSLYKTCVANEVFNDLVEDFFVNWIDDKSLVVGTVKKTLKSLPVKVGFLEAYQPTAETTKDFGEALIDHVCNKDAELLSLIEPTLKNWDVDRVAVMDMILLKMALAELLIFPTIPTKVTLNEFVEISKIYSTEKSKDFINGILDRLLKKLDKEGKINKEGRGLIG